MNAKKFKLVFVFFIFLFLINFSYSLTSTITVTEGDLVSLKPTATDADQDKILFSYSPPLNESGEWQTTLQDAGTYQTIITASDGQSQTEKEIVIIVQNKNQPPQIEKTKLTVEETEIINLKPLASDPDNEFLKLIFEKPFDQDGLWHTTHQDAGTYQTKIIASDLEDKVTQTIEIEVLNKNQPPEITSSFSEKKLFPLTEDESFEFYVNAQDPDNDTLSYSWQLDDQEISQEPSFNYYFNFETAGEHKLNLILSDQEAEIKEIWALKIANLNRAPEIEHPDIVVNEGEKILLQLPATDIDGDFIDYQFSPPLNKTGEWQTTYDAAGSYTAQIVASDGDLHTKEEIEITVKDVDRAPEITLAEKIILAEQEELELDLNNFISDLDGDEITITVENLPETATFKENLIQFRPDFDFVQRKSNFFTNFLNRFRIEKYFFPSNKNIFLPISACGKDLCSSHTLELQVNNLNRAPILEPLQPFTLTETETLSLQPAATDPDSDIVKYTFQKPFNRQGEWTPDYDNDQTEFNTTITASDGTLTDTREVKVTVLNKNRPPTLKITQEFFKLNENQPFSLKIEATDIDQNNLTLSVQELPAGASFQEQVFSWTPSYDTVQDRNPTTMNNFYSKYPSLNRRFNDEMSAFIINFVASDGEFHVVHPIIISVKNVNRPPETQDPSPAKEITIPFNKPVTFHADILDPDQENLTYTWDFGFWDKSLTTDRNKLKRTFRSPGIKTIKVTATDGSYEEELEWKIKVNPPKKIINRTKTIEVALSS